MRLSNQIVVLAITLVLTSTCAAQCSQPTPGAKSVLALAASPVRHKVKSGSPVLLKVSMMNVSRHDVSVWTDAGDGENQYEVDVRDQKRRLPADTEYGKKRNGHVHLETLRFQDLLGSGACVPLKRGKSIDYEVDVSKLYHLEAPGKYYIRLQKADPESAALVMSNTVRVTVLP